MNIKRTQKGIRNLDELTRLFLLFQYAQMSEKQKKDFNKRNIHEIVYRTTKIEEPFVTRRFIESALRHKARYK